jgi:hypothetical protein
VARALLPVLVPGAYVLTASNALLSHTVAMAVQSARLDRHELIVQRLPRQCSGTSFRLPKPVPLTFATRHSLAAWKGDRAVNRLIIEIAAKLDPDGGEAHLGPPTPAFGIFG